MKPWNLITFLLLCSLPADGQIVQFSGSSGAAPPLTQRFNCTGFATSGNSTTGNCGVRFPGSGFGTTMQLLGAFNGSTPSISGTTAILVPTAADHNANNINYELASVNIGQFSSTFTFIPNGMNVAFVLSNNTVTWSGTGTAANGSFTAGASCEGGFFQGFVVPGPPNDTIAVMLESFGGNTANSSTFTYSSVQYYVTNQAPPNPPNAPGQWPCNPNPGNVPDQTVTYVGVNKLSTSPVALNSPASTLNTTTGDTYSATVGYDGSNLSICLYDVTLANGSCSSATSGTGTFFTTTWTGVDIPTLVGASTAWVGLSGSTGTASSFPLIITSFNYFSN